MSSHVSVSTIENTHIRYLICPLPKVKKVVLWSHHQGLVDGILVVVAEIRAPVHTAQSVWTASK